MSNPIDDLNIIINKKGASNSEWNNLLQNLIDSNSKYIIYNNI